MTTRAVLQIHGAPALPAGVRRQPSRPHQIVCVDVVEPRLRIEGLPAPLGSAIETREHDGLLIHRERNELSVTPEGLELIDRPLMNRRRAIRQERGRQQLSRERRGRCWQRLRVVGDLTRDCAARIFLVLDWKEWFARGAVEDEHEPVFRCLRDGVDVLAVAPERHEGRRRGEIPVPDIVAHELEVPHPLARRGFERDERVRKKVVALTIGPVKI